ncbi:hypothetical protein VM98_31455, partial [Streptomyces rubellomurinus subsp. indigoferus]
LTSRRGPDAPGAADLVGDLRALGAEVSVVACDVAHEAAVCALVAGIGERLAAVVHTAGVLDDATVAALTPERLARVRRPKVDAVRHLHEATRHLDLAAFVVFSSVAGVLGTAGQGAYAAANAALDALMADRRAQGLPALSLAWGQWDGPGMAAGLAETDLARMARTGIRPMSADEALALLDAALRRDEPVLVPARLDPVALARRDDLPPILSRLVRAPRRRAAATGTTESPTTLTHRLAALSPAEQRELLDGLVRGHAATVLGHAGAGGIDGEATFKDLGFDSLTAVELRNRLQRATGLRLSTSLVFDHPSPAALASHLLAEVAPGSVARPLLDELDRLEAAFAVPEDEEAVAAVTARLEALLSRLREQRAPAEAAVEAAVEAATVAGRLEAASADKVLDFLQNELGL